MNQRQKQTLPRERAHKNAAESWGAFNGPPRFAMGSHSAVTSFRSTAESSPARIESTYATAHCPAVTILSVAKAYRVFGSVFECRTKSAVARDKFTIVKYTERTVLMWYLKM